MLRHTAASWKRYRVDVLIIARPRKPVSFCFNNTFEKLCDRTRKAHVIDATMIQDQRTKSIMLHELTKCKRFQFQPFVANTDDE